MNKPQNAGEPPRRRKNPSFLPFLDDLDALVDRAEEMWRELVDRAKHLPRTNFELGCEHIARGNLNDALFRFKLVTWLEPTHYLAWHNMGCCYLSKQKPREAADAFRRALALKPDYAESRFMLATIDNALLPANQQPATMPLSMLLAQFEELAPHYNDYYRDQLGYQDHQLLCDAVKRYLNADRKDYTVLDLGAGTGLCGALLRPVAASLAGADISPAMTAEARKLRVDGTKPVYDALQEVDIRALLPTVPPASIELVTAASVFNYVGDLSAVFDGLGNAVARGGLVAFSTDIAKRDVPYHVIPALARFGHSQNYLREQAARTGFEVVSLTEVNAMRGIKMLHCVIRKI